MSDIEVFINNFNLLTWPSKLAEQLSSMKNTRVYIVDNCSNYPPLLQWYKKCPFKVIRLNRNYGKYSVWEAGLIEKYVRGEYFILTDPDLDLQGVPDDLTIHLNESIQILQADKVGISLEYTDLPDEYPLKAHVVSWERQFWDKPVMVNGKLYYSARIDTTLAIMKKDSFPGQEGKNHYRTSQPYIARHCPWHLKINSIKDIPEEYMYYLKTKLRERSAYGNMLISKLGLPVPFKSPWQARNKPDQISFCDE